MSQAPDSSSAWLLRYSNKFHSWRKSFEQGREIYNRRLGLVETSFYVDGEFFEGRADVNALVTLEFRSTSSRKELHDLILLAWTCLGLQHALLISRLEVQKTVDEQQFVIRRPRCSEEALAEAATSLQYVEDFCRSVNTSEFWRHCTNVARVLTPHENYSRLFVLPVTKYSNENSTMSFLLVAGHSIIDGLTTYDWISSFLSLLNTPRVRLEHIIESYCGLSGLKFNLPPAQEDLYPPIQGNRARQRWFWAIIRILRHVRTPLPAAFPNPLFSSQRRSEMQPLPAKYPDIFDYSPERRPPMNSFIKGFTLSRPASERLHRLARSARVSVGACCFALVGITMMQLEEQKHPETPRDKRKPFVASFPLNPRPFFGFHDPPNSCMLAFSDGIVLPFLPSHLPLEGRLKLLSMSAHRQLRRFQKRKTDTEAASHTNSPVRMLAQGYVTAIERIDAKLPPQLRVGVNPQGTYPANIDYGGATCGMSSLGSVKQWLSKGKFPLDLEEKEFAADFRDMQVGVRAREYEFLVSSHTNSDGIAVFGASFDGNSIEEEDFDRFRKTMQQLLEVQGRALL